MNDLVGTKAAEYSETDWLESVKGSWLYISSVRAVIGTSGSYN